LNLGKEKIIGFRTEEELADVGNEIVNDSDSDRGNIPEFSSSEESESESANESDNESNISIPGPSRRQIYVTPTTGFSKNDPQPRTPSFIDNPGVQFAVENEADVMSYFDHYIPPEHNEIIVDQTNSYAQQLSSGLRKYFSIFSNVAFSTVMLTFQRIILIPANHS